MKFQFIYEWLTAHSDKIIDRFSTTFLGINRQKQEKM